jgi:hypothetical protein
MGNIVQGQGAVLHGQGGTALHSNLQRNNPLLHRQLRIVLHSVQPTVTASIALPALPVFELCQD